MISSFSEFVSVGQTEEYKTPTQEREMKVLFAINIKEQTKGVCVT